MKKEPISLENNTVTLSKLTSEERRSLLLEHMRIGANHKNRETYIRQEFMVNDNGSAIQTIHTPFYLAEKIILDLSDKISFWHNKSILVLNVEFLEILFRHGVLLYNKVYFVSDNKLKVQFAKDVYIGDSDDKYIVADFLEWEANMKFDVIIGNPPFKGKGKGLHISFFEKSISILNENGQVIFLHPSTWMISKKKNSHYMKMRRLVGKNVKKISLFNPQPVFGVEMGVPCSITQVDKSSSFEKICVDDDMHNKVWMYKSIHDINIFGDIPEYYSLLNKIKKQINSSGHLRSHVNTKGNYYVNLAKITGHLNKKKTLYQNDFFTMCSKNIVVEKEKQQQYFGFNSEKEAENFLAYCKGYFARFCLATLKFNKNVHMGELEAVPWLNFNKKWTDEKLFAYFGLSNAEINFIKENIPQYYEDVEFPECK